MRRRASESGSALVELTWLALLLLVPLVYVLLAVFFVQRSAYGVTAAARAAGRAYVLAPSEGEALGRARAAAAVAMADQHVPAADAEVTVSCRPTPANCLAPGSLVTVDVAYQVPVPLAPQALGAHRPSVRVRASATVAYGTFREDR